VYAIIEGPEHGWGSAPTLATFGAALVGLALFALRERAARWPMLDLRLFRDRRFSVASGGIALAYFAMFGTFFLVARYTQLVLGYSAFEAGLTILPVPFIMLALAPRGSLVRGPFRPRPRRADRARPRACHIGGRGPDAGGGGRGARAATARRRTGRRDRRGRPARSRNP
jgi:hypothetical protein